MKTSLDCIPCFLEQAIRAARRVTDDDAVHERITRDILRMAADVDFSEPPPVMGQAIHRRLRELTGSKDPYASAKRHFNQLAMNLLPELEIGVEQAAEPLLAATLYSIAANAMDMATVGAATESEIRSALHGALGAPYRADWHEFRKAVTRATDILFLADNAGEIAIDRLLIEQIGPDRVTVAVRGSAVLNDATLADAREVGLEGLVEVLENGSDAPGTLLGDCSPSFRDRFHRADLVIAKGQGNFESLSGVAANSFFLFKVKCPLVSRHVALPLGTHALLRQAATRTIPVTVRHESHP